MILAKFWRLPPLEGLLRLLDAKWSNLVQLGRSSGEWVMRLRMLERAVQHAGLADLGMCLMMGVFTEGWLKVVTVRGLQEEKCQKVE